MSRGGMGREQRLACNLALSAQTPGEVEAAHVLMMRAFPKLVAAYPCDCAACAHERERVEEASAYARRHGGIHAEYEAFDEEDAG